MTAGEGGALLCRSEEHAWRAASIIDCGRPHDPDEQMYMQGGNYRMTELQAALLNVAMERFPAQFQEREAMADYLDESLSEIEGVRILPRDPRHHKRAVYCYTFAIDPASFGATNDVVARAMQAEGIYCWCGYDPMYRYDLFRPTESRLPVPSAFPEYFDFENMHLPVTERISGADRQCGLKKPSSAPAMRARIMLAMRCARCVGSSLAIHRWQNASARCDGVHWATVVG